MVNFPKPFVEMQSRWTISFVFSSLFFALGCFYFACHGHLMEGALSLSKLNRDNSNIILKCKFQVSVNATECIIIRYPMVG